MQAPELHVPTESITDPEEGRKFVEEYFQTAVVWTMCTVLENCEPKCRPLSIFFEQDGQLVFSTTRKKDIFEELSKNNVCSIVATVPKHGWLRIQAKAVEVEDQARADENAQKAIPSHYEIYLTDNPKDNVHYALTEASCKFFGKKTVDIAI